MNIHQEFIKKLVYRNEKFMKYSLEIHEMFIRNSLNIDKKFTNIHCIVIINSLKKSNCL